MLLDLSRLRGAEHVRRRFEPDEFGPAEGEFRVVAPVELDVDVQKDGSKARLTGRVSATLELGCGRCLDPFTVPVDAAIDALLLPADSTLGAGEHEVAADDLGVSFYRDDAIDLGELVKEQFFLALPMKPLCQVECRGLCPVCGVNRNREACSCQSEWVDPRLEALKRFTSSQ